MPAIDIDRLATILREAAKAEILPRFRRLAPDQIKRKSEAIDLVTEADTEAERWIKSEVAKLAPNALFVGEESVAADARLLDALDTAELAVVVDPVDGTANFAAGLPLYAVMAAVVDHGQTVAGIIYDPMGDDWVLAEKGSGAFQRRPDGTQFRLQVADPVPLAEMIGSVSVAFIEPKSRPQVLSNLAKIRLTANYRCAGHDYRLLAGANINFAMYNKLMPWDHLGGTLIVQEAGGFVAHVDGSPYRPQDREGGLIAATDKDTFELLSSEVFTV